MHACRYGESHVKLIKTMLQLGAIAASKRVRQNMKALGRFSRFRFCQTIYTYARPPRGCIVRAGGPMESN